MTLYEAGDIVEYQPFGGGSRLVLVTARYRHDVKLGQDEPCAGTCTMTDRPGFDGKTIGAEDSVWGYDAQILRVWRATAPVRTV